MNAIARGLLPEYGIRMAKSLVGIVTEMANIMKYKSVAILLILMIGSLALWFILIRDPGPRSDKDARQRLRENDPETALSYLTARAELNDPEAMTTLGMLYTGGVMDNNMSYKASIFHDSAKGISYLEHAVRLNDPNAMVALAAVYTLGQETPANDAEAERLLRVAVKSRNDDAFLGLGERLALDRTKCDIGSITLNKGKGAESCSKQKLRSLRTEATMWLNRAEVSSNTSISQSAHTILAGLNEGEYGPVDIQPNEHSPALNRPGTDGADKDLELDADRRRKYDSLSPEGKEFFREQMRQYDDACALHQIDC